jgi:polysaccharide export outer membrane protein
MKKHFPITILTILFFILNPINLLNQLNSINLFNRTNQTNEINDINDLNHLNVLNQINQSNQITNSIAFAQEARKKPGTGPTQPAPAISKRPFQILPLDVSENYVIGQGDVLEVFVWRNEQLSRQITVRPDGKISLPLIQDLQAEGLTVLQLKDQITRGFKQYVQNPTVTVIVSQINSYKISVLGKVSQPGVYAITTKTTLLEAISMAGGFTEWANQRKITVIRSQGGQKKKLRINYKKIVSGKDPSQNIILDRGDTIIVP